MKITKSHLEFWNAKTVRAPSWLKEIQKPMAVPSIHTLINSQVVRKTRMKTEPANTIALLKLARSRGIRLSTKVLAMATNPGCSNAIARSSYCFRWLARLEGIKRSKIIPRGIYLAMSA